tara:strand:+ start:331 stop:591 length:261 start_codon:yes stop_codon:yes gene_type:complete
MAVGDVVNGIFSGGGSWVSFQPAAGVEVCITGVIDYIRITDGVTNTTDDQTTGTGVFQMKCMINNTVYVGIYASSNGTCYTGIQIK